MVNGKRRKISGYVIGIITITLLAAASAFIIGYAIARNHKNNISGFYNSTLDNVTGRIDSIRGEVLDELSDDHKA